MKTPPLHRMVSNFGSRMLSIAAIASAALLLTPSASTAAVRGLYVGGDFYPLTSNTEGRALDSGFNRLFLFTTHIRANGDVYYNDKLIATNGQYVGDSNWGSRLASVKSDGRISRIELCIGSWGSVAFDSIRDLVASQGTGTNSILYKNFRAIKNALPSVSAIQYDDEKTYHTSSAVAFGQMLIGMGFKVTLCPYNWGTRTFWQSVKSQLGSNCDAIYLQCYDGGAGNNPADWNAVFGGFRVTPGLWGNTTSTKDCIARFRAWKAGGICNGGFMWLNASVQWDVDLWGDCMKIALEPQPFMMIVNKNSGKTLDLKGGGTENDVRVQQWSYDYDNGNQKWALLPTPDQKHFKIVSWVSGRAMSIPGHSTARGAEVRAVAFDRYPSQMWDLVYAGEGWYQIKNVNSGLVLDVANASTADNAKIQQWTDNGTDAQLFRFQPMGSYYLRTLHGKYLTAQGSGASQRVLQKTQQNNNSFKWRFAVNGQGWQRVSSLEHPSGAIAVEDSSKEAGAKVNYRAYNGAESQRLRMLPLTDGSFKFYYRHSGLAWDIPGGSSAEDLQMEQHPNNNGLHRQNFRLERID